MDIYKELILDHYKNPRNHGHLEKPDASLELGNPLCGDRIGMDIKILTTKCQILDTVSFWGDGCAISQSTASMLTEKVKGMKPEEIKKIKYEDLKKMLGIELSPARIKCAMLPLEVLQKTLDLLS